MNVLEPVYGILCTVARALQVCQEEDRDFWTKWNSETRFCSSLRSTLQDITTASLPIDQNFIHKEELSILIEAIVKPLSSFYSTLAPRIASLQQAGGPRISKQATARLAAYLEGSVIQPVKTLKRQVYRYLQGLDTLLLLYAIDILYSAPEQVMTEQQLGQLQSLERRTKAVSSQGLVQLASFISAKSLGIQQQQECLVEARQAIHHHWQTVELTIHGVWSTAGNDSDESPSSANMSGGDGNSVKVFAVQRPRQGHDSDSRHMSHKPTGNAIDAAHPSQRHVSPTTSPASSRTGHIDSEAKVGPKSSPCGITHSVTRRKEASLTNNQLHPPAMVHGGHDASSRRQHQAPHKSTLPSTHVDPRKRKPANGPLNTWSGHQSSASPQSNQHQMQPERATTGNKSIPSSHQQPCLAASKQPRCGATGTRSAYNEAHENHGSVHLKPMSKSNANRGNSALGGGEVAASAGGATGLETNATHTAEMRVHQDDGRGQLPRSHVGDEGAGGKKGSSSCCIIL